MPPFVSSNKQMSQHELIATQQIASPRIAIEMKMEQIKNFRILQGVFNLAEAHLSEQIVLICTAATNLQDPLLVKCKVIFSCTVFTVANMVSAASVIVAIFFYVQANSTLFKTFLNVWSYSCDQIEHSLQISF